MGSEMNVADKYAYKVVWSNEDGEYVATVAELPSLSWLAPTQSEAINGLHSLVEEVVADMQVSGEKVPEPLSVRSFSGKFQVRIPPDLHRRLVIEAAEEHVSLNRLIAMKLA